VTGAVFPELMVMRDCNCWTLKLAKGIVPPGAEKSPEVRVRFHPALVPRASMARQGAGLVSTIWSEPSSVTPGKAIG
jgi:hypothetical protein